MTFTRFTLFSALLLGPIAVVPAAAQALVPSVFVDALVNGSSEAPLPQERVLQRAVAELERMSGSTGAFVIQARRVTRFASQQRCGRVAFVVAQPASHRVFPQLGGELNLCDDGQPPLRQCADRPGILVPATSRCQGGSAPVETEEIAAAVRAAIGRGAIQPGSRTGKQQPEDAR